MITMCAFATPAPYVALRRRKVSSGSCLCLFRCASDERQLIGTPQYWAPELFKCKAAGTGTKCTFATEVYSFGLVLYEIATGKLPFDDMDLKELEAFVLAVRAFE